MYTDPIVVNDAIFIKAIAYKTGFPHSAVTSSSYVISQVVAPVFDPEAGNLLAGAEISLSSTTADAVIYYTSDGTDPSCDGSGTSTQYTAPLSDNTEGTYTYKAIACKTNYLDSTISTSIYAVSMVGVVNTPTFSQLAATYTETQLVSISSSTEGAVIRYTDDGSVPTCSTGTIYSTAISIANPGLTLKAIACKINWTNSSVATASYTITGTVAAPTFNLVAGTYTSTQSVTISSATSGAVIHYTIDGSTPTCSSTTYSTAISVANPGFTLKAIACKTDWIDSAISTSTYLITGTLSAPSISPTPGTYTSAQNVTISNIDAGSSIYYTLDGTTPTCSTGSLYASAINISVSNLYIVKAISCKTDWISSSVTTSTYSITGTVATPSISPSAGTYTSAQTVTMSSSTSGATIRYTTNGSTPTCSSTLYSSAISVSVTTTIQAIACKTDWNNSEVASAAYTVQVLTPAISPVAGTYNNNQSVTITDGTSGAAIYYTTNGDTPTSSSTLYTGAFTVSASSTIKAIAIKAQLLDSNVASNTYVLQAVTPTFSPIAGGVVNGTAITLTTSTTGASIYYTTDGSTPTSSSSLYNSGNKPTVTPPVTLKAIAIKNGYADSAVASGSYTVLAVGDKATFTGSGVTFKMAYVPGGLTFKAGTADDTPTTIDNAYWIGETPVTYELWYTVRVWAISQGYTFANAGRAGNNGTIGAAPSTTKQQPVVTTNWRDTMVWMNALTEWYNAINGTSYTCAYYTDAGYTTPIRTSTSSTTITYTTNGTQDAPYVKVDATGFRMLTSMEWELAARYKGSDSTNGAYEWPVGSSKWWTPGTYASGSTAATTDATATGLVAWYSVNSGNTTHDVKGKTPNTLGLYDMSGNAWQVCFDWKPGMIGSTRVTRGGSYFYGTSELQTGYLSDASQVYFANGYGHGGVRFAMTAGTLLPSISPVAGTYNNDQSVTITDGTSGASIYYTTDGSTPTSSSTLYTGAFTVSASSTVKAIAIKAQLLNSNVASNAYVIQAATPTFSPVVQAVPSGTAVTITTSTTGASIYYTTDGSTPTSSSSLYDPGNKPTITTSITLKAIAIKSGYSDSSIASISYTISLPKIYAGGDLTTYNGTARNKIASINTDGSLYTSFNPGTGANNTISASAVQLDGKIIIGGNFTTYNGTTRKYIARINTDGTLDTTFNSGTVVDGQVYAIAIQSDGKILIGGQFGYYMLRLNSDGTKDTSFYPSPGAAVYAIAIQSDGKSIVGGIFSNASGGTVSTRLARINTDGTLDTSFNTGLIGPTGGSQTVDSIAIQSDGKIIIGGAFYYYNGTMSRGLARINTDGSLDTNFNVGTGTLSYRVSSVVIQSNGKIIIGGEFTEYKGTARKYIARVNTDGTLDTTFDPGTGPSSYVKASLVQSDGKIVIAGFFTTYKGTARSRIARTNTDGTLDTSFTPGTGFDNSVFTIGIMY